MKVYVVSKTNCKTEVVGVYKTEDDAEKFIRFMGFYDSDHGIRDNDYFYEEFEVEEWQD